ncbi:MAG: DUF885 family protein [Phycisphaerales bacterium JB039]
MLVRLVAALAALPTLVACQAQPAQSPSSAAEQLAAAAAAHPAIMPLVIERFGADARDVERFYDAPWSETRWQRIDELHDAWAASLDAIDFDTLDQDGRIDWLLLDNHIRAGADDIDLDRRRLAEIAPLLPFRDAIIELEVARWRIEPADPRAMAGAVAEIAEQTEAISKRVKRADPDDESPSADDQAGDADPAETGGAESYAADEAGPIQITPATALRASRAVGALRRTLDGTASYYTGYKPEFDWWVSQPAEAALDALRDYENKLRRDIAGIKGEDDDPLVGDPIGRDALLADLRAEMIAYTPEELIAIAERELAWRQQEMIAASREMGFGDDWKAALEEVKGRAVPPGEQDLYVAAVARETIAFLDAGDMVTIPPLCRELWRAEMIPARDQKTWPFAFYGGLHVGIAYPTDEMSHADKLESMRGNNRHFTRNVTPHELVPGHHLQGFMAQRHNTHRRMFSTPFLGEGWCLYWEMVFYDRGWAESPEDRIGILFWGMHRCARIIVSLKYHLGEMTPQEMIDFLVDEIGHERFGATSEVRRYIGDQYSPLYQVAYMIGGLQMRALRREVVDTGLMTEKQFHDTVLLYNSMPIELIRAGLLDLPLTKDWRPSWRFADPIETGPDQPEPAPAATGDSR